MRQEQEDKNTHLFNPTFRRSLIALAVLGATAPVMAQEASTDSPQAAQEQVKDGNADEEEAIEVISVQGLRRSYADAKSIKMESSTFVDAISASDIGALPDRSVLEAMQRIPGVSIERFAAADDPDHFGVEGSGAVIRGMSATRSEFNGRDSFSANSGRGLSFQDVSPELMGSVRVYKNQSADMIEGGIGGTVSLHTRLPFDEDKRVMAFSGDVTYNDMSETYDPSVSGLFSDVWDTDSGKFGMLVSLAHNEVTSQSDSLQSEVVLPRDDLIPGESVWAPNGGNIGRKLDERERFGASLAAQWESEDQTTLVTGQFLRSDADLAWNENTLSYQTNMFADDGSIRRESFHLDGTEFEYSDSGTFQKGYLTNTPEGGWRSNGRDGERVPQAADWSGNPVQQFGNTHQTTTRLKEQSTLVDDYSLNFKYRPNDSWSHELDLQYIEAETEDDDVTLYLGVQANQYMDLTGDVPKIGYLEPWNGNPAGNGREGNPDFFQDPASYYWRSAMDHVERSDGDSKAARYDIKYVFDEGFFTSVKAGIRYAKREQTVRFSAYNWKDLGAIFSQDTDGDGHSAAWLDLPGNESLLNDIQHVSWNDHHRGNTVTIPGGTTIHPSMELVRDYTNWTSRLDPVNSNWTPLSERMIPMGADANGNTIYEELDGYFRPAEINDFEETNKAIYFRADFETFIGDYVVSGNIGARYVETERETSGFVTYPDLRAPDPNDTTDYRNVLPDEQKAYGNYGVQEIKDKVTDDHFLPSFNAKLEITDELLVRFAASKAIAYPDTGDMKNFVSINAGATTVEREDVIDPNVDPDVIYAHVDEWVGNSGNARLKPMESIQYDLGVEWYFAENGMLSAAVFYKDLSNFFVTGGTVEEYTNSGVTNEVVIQKPLNSGDGSMEGFELSYNQFYSGLPAPFDGLGTEITYGYVSASGVPNSNLYRTSVDGAPASGGSAELEFSSLPLQGQSDHTVNLALMYEKGPISSRLAYNWRSDYLITVRDVIAPYRPIYSESAGFLDGSIFYNINESVKIGLQGSNLLDTVSKTSMQINDEGDRRGRSWFVNDRRYSLVVRAVF